MIREESTREYSLTTNWTNNTYPNFDTNQCSQNAPIIENGNYDDTFSSATLDHDCKCIKMQFNSSFREGLLSFVKYFFRPCTVSGTTAPFYATTIIRRYSDTHSGENVQPSPSSSTTRAVAKTFKSSVGQKHQAERRLLQFNWYFIYLINTLALKLYKRNYMNSCLFVFC